MVKYLFWVQKIISLLSAQSWDREQYDKSM